MKLVDFKGAQPKGGLDKEELMIVPAGVPIGIVRRSSGSLDVQGGKLAEVTLNTQTYTFPEECFIIPVSQFLRMAKGYIQIDEVKRKDVKEG
jgi:hypothetical protein